MDTSSEVLHHELINARVEDAMVRLLAIAGASDGTIEVILMKLAMLDSAAKAKLVTELPSLMQVYLDAKDSDPQSEAIYDRRTAPRGGRRRYDLLEADTDEADDGDVDTYLLDSTLRATPGLMSSETVCAQEECTEACGFIHLEEDEDREVRTLNEAAIDGMIERNARKAAAGGTPVWV